MKISERQLRWLRFRRSGLAEPLGSPAAVAQRLIGVQAQMPSAVELAIRKRLEKGESLTYKDVRSKKLEEGQDLWVVAYAVFMLLVREGVTCHGPERDGQSTSVHREIWLRDLAWDPPPSDEAMPELARRYLAAYGPAEPLDAAFWYGGTVTRAKAWMAPIRDDLTEVEVGGRTLLCRTDDLDDLRETPPTPSRWPVKLLPRFDSMVLATKDKSWLVDKANYSKVWRPSAQVEAVLLVDGRIAGTWRYDRLARGLRVRITPFAPLAARVAKAAEREAAATAEFLGVDLAAYEIAAS